MLIYVSIYNAHLALKIRSKSDNSTYAPASPSTNHTSVPSFIPGRDSTNPLNNADKRNSANNGQLDGGLQLAITDGRVKYIIFIYYKLINKIIIYIILIRINQ